MGLPEKKNKGESKLTVMLHTKVSEVRDETGLDWAEPEPTGTLC